MEGYRKILSVMPKDDLALELELLQGRYMQFQYADRSYNDPAESRRRVENNIKLKFVKEEIARRNIKKTV